MSDSLSNDSVYIDMVPSTNEDKPRRYTSTTAALRSQFFHSSVNETKPKSVEEKTIIEVSNETLDAAKQERNLEVESSKL